MISKITEATLGYCLFHFYRNEYLSMPGLLKDFIDSVRLNPVLIPFLQISFLKNSLALFLQYPHVGVTSVLLSHMATFHGWCRTQNFDD